MQTPATGRATGVELTIGGMTCASCAARVERRLNRLEGVTASVNLATEKAQVAFPETMDPAELIAQVEAAGYTATLPRPAPPAAAETDPARPLRDRLLASVALSVPVVAMAMLPALQFRHWQWISLALATPVAIWAAWPFHKATWMNLRHGAATMDTLISVGVLAAFS